MTRDWLPATCAKTQLIKALPNITRSSGGITADFQEKPMLPLFALAVPTILETLAVAAATAAVITVSNRATSDAYDAATKKKKEDSED